MKKLLNKKTKVRFVKLNATRHDLHIPHWQLLTFVLVFGILGSYLLFRSMAATTSLTFIPSVDSYVSASSPTSNYGNDTTNQVDSSPVMKAYLRFDLTSLGGQSVTSAKLRFYVTNGSRDSFNLKTVADTAWTETGITYGNQPSMGAVISKFTASSVNAWKEVDVTSYVISKAGQHASLGIEGIHRKGDGMDFYSKDNVTNKPQLIVTVTSPDTPPTDTTAPTVNTTFPVSGSSVNGVIDITANASDNIGVSRVEFYHGITKIGEDTSSPYSQSWDTSTVTNGDYSLVAKAFDAAGNNAPSAAVNITVSNTALPPQPPTAYTCTKTLSVGGGLQAFVDSLADGQIGCLRGGTHNANNTTSTTYSLALSKPGVTLASTPGERATIDLKGLEAQVRPEGNRVVVRRIDFTTTDNHTIRVYGDNVVLEDNTFTNSGNAASGSCVGVGGSDKITVNLKIQRNIFKDCGSNSTNQNHGIYAAHFKTLTIVDNLFYGNGAYRIQLYPEADGAYVAHNIFDNQGAARGAVVISTETQYSRNHSLERNIVVNTANWGGLYVNNSKPNISGNKANYNCFFNNPTGNITGTFDQGTVGNITQNPLFVNAGARDYRLQAGSPCLSVVEYDTFAKITANR